MTPEQRAQLAIAGGSSIASMESRVSAQIREAVAEERKRWENLAPVQVPLRHIGHWVEIPFTSPFHLSGSALTHALTSAIVSKELIWRKKF